MEKRNLTMLKIISRLLIFIFIVSIFNDVLIVQAVNTPSMSSLYASPNQGGNNAYKFKVSDVVNPGMLSAVVGCTGVVNKVSTWMMKLIQSPTQTAKLAAAKLEKVKDQLKSACTNVKAASEAAGDSAPFIGGLSRSIDTIFTKLKFKLGGGEGEIKACQDQVASTDDKVLAEAVKQTEQEAEANLRVQCLDGIAITLAKNQLTAMTKSAMNWVNSGYGGNPFYVQNMKNFTNNLEKRVLENEIDRFLTPERAFPYGTAFSQSAILAYKTGSSLRTDGTSFIDSLTSDLGAFVTDNFSTGITGTNGVVQDTRTATQKAIDINYSYSKDFGNGGWDAFLAVTQRDQNNPLGFSMNAAQSIAKQQQQQVTQQQNEISENNGFLSQKICVSWKVLNETGGTVFDPVQNKIRTTTNPTEAEKNNPYGCSEYKIITPGSIIRDKTSNYLNSPDRQLELAKTINDSLNALFSVLITKLESGGLMGLSVSATDTPMNWTDSINYSTPDGNTSYNNNGAYDGFNLTRDLGNTYIHTVPTSLGTWNANANPTLGITNLTSDGQKLYRGSGPIKYLDDGTLADTTNTYYTVNKAGLTKIMIDDYNGWAVGDRAFWDGTKWQNWRLGQINPIAKKGVIQTQQDYIVAATDIIKVLPNIMRSLGELDYCLPGPNPSYMTNSTEAQTSYQDWIGTIYVGAKNQTDTDRQEWAIDRENSRTYKIFQELFVDNQNTWKKITESSSVAWFLNYFGDFTETQWKGVVSYSYRGDDAAKLAEARLLQEINLNYVNNNLFPNFYEIFDKMMDKLYFKNITKMYLDTEVSIGINKNPDYVPMAQDGYNLTKDIVSQGDQIAKAIADYTEGIKQAKINIAKLNPIKNEVSAIIKAAQDRRNKLLVTKLGLPLAQIQTKYATCFAEENIQFYDADIISKAGNIVTENCTDGIDNDLNGLIDRQDPACSGNN